ncbi:MAG: AAA family ATPase [Acidimicrobiales bacterium]
MSIDLSEVGVNPMKHEADAAAISVVVVERDPEMRETLARMLGSGVQPELLAAIDPLYRLRPGERIIAVLGPSHADTEGLAAIDSLVRGRPTLGVILVVEELSTDLLKAALRAGVRDAVVTSTDDRGQLPESVQRLAASLRRMADGPGTGTESEDESSRAQLITVFSTKGGAGKSVLATNLAAVLARRSSRPVALVDADLQFGDVAVMLKLFPHHTIVEAVEAGNRLDAALLQSLLVHHDPTGVLVLPAPLEPAFADQIGTGDMARIVSVLRSFCSFVVVDTPAHFGEVVLGLLEDSDHICLVAGLDIPTIKNVKLGLQTLRLLDVPMSKIKLVVNRSNSKVRMDVSEVERTLGVKADVLIPSDLAVPQSVNRGLPVTLESPRTDVARALEQLADQFAPVPVAKGRRRGRK